MDQIKTGRFIAQERKAKHLTQRQLADQLSISDKTVSKWECGNGLPEVSLMLPLCHVLGITVNELLCGQRTLPEDYQFRAEENMIKLLYENQENKKNMALSIICGCITIVAVLALIIIASLVEMPSPARVAIIVLAAVTGSVGVGAAVLLDVKAGYFQCPHCQELFVPTTSEYVKSYHTFTKRRLRCPRCGKTSMCHKRVVKPD